jgi:hypothetical protein
MLEEPPSLQIPVGFVHVVFLLPDIRRGYDFFVPKDHLHLGREIHVFLDYTTEKPGARIEAEPFHGSRPRYITSVRPFNDEVTLDPKPELSVIIREKLPDNFADEDANAIFPLVSDALTQEQVRLACRNLARDIKVSKLYSTEHKRASNLEAVKTVADRLDLCARLDSAAGRDTVGTHQRSLVTYLLLTCFDRLGQPAHYMTFEQFLDSKKKKSAREAVVNALPDAHPVEVARALNRAYIDEYGVKNSFFRFFDKVLPEASKHNLLDALRIIDRPLFPLNVSDVTEDKLPDASDDEKLKYLFALRNAYTHRAEFTRGLTEYESLLEPEFVTPEMRANSITVHDQIHGQTTFRSMGGINWIPTLFETVRQGLIARLQAALGDSE